MLALLSKSIRNRRALAALVILLVLGLAAPVSMHGSDKKKKNTDTAPAADRALRRTA